MMAICNRCGAEFTARNTRSRFCPECRIPAKREYNLQYLRDRRSSERADRETAHRIQTENELKSRKQTEADRVEKRQQDLQRRAAQGDYFAQAMLAMDAGDYIEYWTCQRLAHLEADKKRNRITSAVLCGINVYDDNFDEKLREVFKR